jgi:hypothetical protein
MRRPLALGAVVLAAGSAGMGLGGSTSEAISIAVRPTVLRWAQATTLTGSVSSGKPAVDVYIEARTCGEGPWDDISGAHTVEGGGFSAEFGAGIMLLVRASAEGATSNVVRVQQRPSVTLQERPRGTFFVLVNAARSFWRKQIVFQRFDTQRRNWVDLKTVRLTKTGSNPGSPFQWSKTGHFKQKAPKGTTFRATLPLSQARPCYVAGYSNILNE